MNFHGPRTRKYLTYKQGIFHYRVQDCSLGLYYTQCIFMDPQIKTSWPKGQEVFHYWVHDSTSVSKMSLSKSQCTLMDPKINKSHVESWLLNLMYHSGLFWSTIVHEYQKVQLASSIYPSFIKIKQGRFDAFIVQNSMYTYDITWHNVTSDDSVLGRGFISHSPKISCQFATKIRMIRLTFMFT